ncbi:MAG: hypothetical protein AB7V18_08970 [Pyrinomonadaceae bacterium]
MEHLVIASFVFLNLFMLLGAVDLFYFHIWKYKLHTRPESRYEHKLHMLFAFLMVPVGFFLYYQNFSGWALWAGVFFVLAALATELADVFSENDSRASIGGLSTAEYSLHVILTILKVASFAFLFASKPVEAWSLSSATVQGSYGTLAESMALQVMIGSFVVGLLHLALLNRRIGSVSCSQTIGAVARCDRFSCCAS